MNIKELFKKVKDEKKGGGAKTLPAIEYLTGETILEPTSIATFYQNTFAVSAEYIGNSFDASISSVDITINNVTYSNLPIEVYEAEGYLECYINIPNGVAPSFDSAPIAIDIMTSSEESSTYFLTPEEGEYTISMKRSGAKRVMKLHGASRTYSHTAEPRNVKAAEGVKGWPIKKEMATLVDGSFDCEDDIPVQIAEWSGTSDDFVNQTLSVTVNGTEAEKTEWGFQIEDFAEIYYETGYIWLYTYDSGTYWIKIITDKIEVAEDFKEAVVLSGLVTIIEGKQEDDDPEADMVFIPLNEMIALLQSGKIVYLKYPYDNGVNMCLVTGMYYDAMNQITNISAIVEGTVKPALNVREDGMIMI